jgi:hypothetical protein
MARWQEHSLDPESVATTAGSARGLDWQWTRNVPLPRTTLLKQIDYNLAYLAGIRVRRDIFFTHR